MRKVCLLGASGSIGKQTLDVMKKNPSDFELVGFSVGQRTQKIHHVLRVFPSVRYICIAKKNKLAYYQKTYPEVHFYSGDSGLLELIKNSAADMVVNALVGFVGLKPTLFALENNLDVCLANKEALVVGGELVNSLLKQGKGKLYPIDSEHSALKKCLMVDDQNINKLMLTASGGAFRNLKREELTNVKASDALKHPTWKMGPKITIDCATMVNKSFEIIEAHYLFGYTYSQIGIKLHDESYVHSYILYKDGTMRLDVGKPDMRVPIKHALYGYNIPFKTVLTDDLSKIKNCHFHTFDLKRYPIVEWAKTVIDEKGTYGAVFNAANEVAVHAYLRDEIAFLDIERIINKLMKEHKNTSHPTYEQLADVDLATRMSVYKMIKKGEIA